MDLQDFLDNSFFDDVEFDAEETNNENAIPVENEDEVITTFLKLKLETAETDVRKLTESLLEKQRFQNELFRKMENDNKIISEHNLELIDPISIKSQWINIYDGTLVLGFELFNEALSSLTNFEAILDVDGYYHLKKFKWEDKVLTATDRLETKSSFWALITLNLPTFDSDSEISLDGVFVFKIDNRSMQFKMPELRISAKSIYKNLYKLDLNSPNVSKENILSFIGISSQITFLFDFANHDIQSISELAEILHQLNFVTALTPYYWNSTLLLQIIQVPENNNLFLVKIHFKSKSDINILMQVLKLNISQIFTISEVEEDK